MFDIRTSTAPRGVSTWRCCVLVAAALGCTGVQAGGGPLGIDHELALDQSGVWARRYQITLEYGVVAFELLGAVWLGDDDSFGHTLWQTTDASIVSGVGATALKLAFGRSRPDAGQGPNSWFRGRSNESFPSGEVTLQASFVTPLIVRYAPQNPWVWALEALPVYDGIARMKSQAHWQSDVLAGWAIGTASGLWAAQKDSPLSVQLLPRGLSVGYSRRF